jgi:hypothetical protein
MKIAPEQIDLVHAAQRLGFHVFERQRFLRSSIYEVRMGDDVLVTSGEDPYKTLATAFFYYFNSRDLWS